IELFKLELARLLLEHHGNVVANRKGELVGTANELFRLFVVLQRPLAKRANENIEQSGIHQYSSVWGWTPRTSASSRAASVSENAIASGTRQAWAGGVSTFTASLSVMSIGRSASSLSSSAVKAA